MAQVHIELPHHRYDVTIEPGALERLGSIVRDVAPHGHCALLADRTVFELHGERAQRSLSEAGYEPLVATIDPGEANKNLTTVERLYDVLLEARLERRSPIIALGGGVAGDTVGFVASTYLRGVPVVQCPTTLLSMVDSSVGGKTGVNVPQGKNLVGTFYQPAAVAIDPEVLTTLPERELRCGLGECIKHGVIRDASLFEFIGAELSRILSVDADALVELVRRDVEIKAAVVMEDEREAGVRAHLNFGHTFAHAIETTTGYGHVQHGEAVALGMLAATRTAVEMGLCHDELLDRLAALIEAAGLPVRAALPCDEELDAAMRLDKKVAGARIRFVLPERMGQVTIRDDVPPECVHAGWRAIRSTASE
jgi:3-dehydroquinate synthase